MSWSSRLVIRQGNAVLTRATLVPDWAPLQVATAGPGRLTLEDDGCELYAMHEDADTIVMIEKWTSAGALAAHAAAPALAALNPQLEGKLATRTVVKVYTPHPAGTPTPLVAAHNLWDAVQAANHALAVLVSDGYTFHEAGEDLPAAWQDRFNTVTGELDDALWVGL